MMCKRVVPILAIAALAFAARPASARCDTWDAWSPAQHNRVDVPTGYVDAVGGHGYGSGFHDAAHQSSTGKYGDPQRRAAEGGYVQGSLGDGAVNFNINAFSPLDETNNGHVYDTAAGACVSVAGTDVATGEQYVPTSAIQLP